MRAAAFALVAVAATACRVGDDYVRPPLDDVLPAAFTSDDAGTDVDVASWWNALDDDELASLVELALSDAFDVVEARERVIAAWARRGVEDAARQFTLDGSLSYQRAKTGDDALALAGAPPGVSTDIYSVGVAPAWELDLWGRIGRLVEAADAEIDVAEDDWRAARVAVAAEVARTVLEIRGLDAELQVVRDTLASDEDVVAITASRARAGFADELDVSRARRTLETTGATLTRLDGDRRERELALAALLGRAPGEITVSVRPLPRRDVVPALGVPADLLTRRPDVRSAERALAAARARVGAAEAERYPDVSISGQLSLQGRNTSDLVNRDAYVLGIGPSLTVPLLDGGRIDALVAQAESDERLALTRLRRAVVDALVEVDTAATQRSRAEQRVARLDAAERAARDTEQLSLDRFGAGAVDFLDVTEARTQRLAIERDRRVAERDALVRLVDLYAALGGGWAGVPE